MALVAGASRGADRGIAVDLGAAGATVCVTGRSMRAARSDEPLAKLYGFTDLDGSRPDAWPYLVEVQDAGRPADVSGYR